MRGYFVRFIMTNSAQPSALTTRQISHYAEATARMIGVRGHAPRERVIAMLRALELSEDEIARVLDEGLERSLFAQEPGEEVLRVSGEPEGESSRAQEEADYKPSAEQLIPVLFDSLPIVVWAIDTKGLFVMYEGKGIERLGVPRGFLVGKNYFELFSEHESAKDVHCALAGEVSHSFTVYEGVPYENWCVPTRDAEGRIEWILFVSLDITDPKKYEHELHAKLELIEEQQRVITELSTPIIQVWDKVLTLPLLGVVNSERVIAMMENLLAEVVRTRARFAILDLTGVEDIDPTTASHLIQLIQAIRLLGAEGIISGIRPSVAQTMISLGVGFEGIVTHANLRNALEFCIRSMRVATA